jgi:hypothetical protein
MALRKIAETCDDGDCPTVYEDDLTGDVLVQGYVTTSQRPATPIGEDVVRIPAADWRKLMTQLSR